jgi:hypothetical protein
MTGVERSDAPAGQATTVPSRLAARVMTVARLAAAPIALLAVLAFAAGIAAAARELGAAGRHTPEDLGALARAGLSVESYAAIATLSAIVVGIAFAVPAVLILVLRSDDPSRS